MPTRKTACWIVFLTTAWSLAGFAQEGAPARTLQELRGKLEEHLDQPRFAAAMWGVKVASLDTGVVLFERNSQKLFSPASNSKLYTLALALDRLGPDYRIKTSLYARSRPDKHGTLKGDLVLFGRGDPTLNARFHHSNIFEALQPLIAALTNAGVRRISGDLIADESFFHGPPMGSGWSWEDLDNAYGAEVSALTINDNVLQASVKPNTRTGGLCIVALSPATNFLTISNRTETVAKGVDRLISLYRPLGENCLFVSGRLPLDDTGYTENVTVHHPAALFAALFKETLKRNGIRFRGKARAVNWVDRQVNPLDLNQWIELGFVESPPLNELAKETAKPSQNLYTDLLLAHVGEVSRNPQTPLGQTSESLGLRQLNRFLAGAGIRRGDVQFEDGSGLSRNNLTTPDATIALLQFMNHHACGAVFQEALPIAGVDGTLKERMIGTPAQGNVRAKTGTLRWADCLSGYVTSASGERLAFSVMLNRFLNQGTGRSARAEVDTVAVMLAGFSGKSTE
jgi:D-alanyl-D-alanine carboxypeptidase/D-alanyl-D-alanine-endopeptidase (penicillin-binding protein 4)